MDIYVPATQKGPEVFEQAFIEKHGALGLKATSGSGSFWSDGDGRPEAKTSGLTFAMEAKTRWSDRHTNAKPKAGEWRKAMGEKSAKSRKNYRGQLKKFDGTAIRLFVVYYNEEATYAVSIPEKDFTRLVETVTSKIAFADDCTPLYGRKETITSKGETYDYVFLPYRDWKDLYKQIDWHVNGSPLDGIFD